jgi:hypothetical protein
MPLISQNGGWQGLRSLILDAPLVGSLAMQDQTRRRFGGLTCIPVAIEGRSLKVLNISALAIRRSPNLAEGFCVNLEMADKNIRSGRDQCSC